MLNPAARNDLFQPRTTLKAQVLKPAQARIMGGEHRRVDFKVSRPSEAVVRFTTVKAGGR